MALSGRYPLDIFSANKGDMQKRTRTKGAADLNIWVTMLNNGGIIGCAACSRSFPAACDPKGRERRRIVCLPQISTMAHAPLPHVLPSVQYVPVSVKGAACRCRVASNPWGAGVGYIPYDGVVVDLGTLPGSWYLGYNVGKNCVHEVGHW